MIPIFFNHIIKYVNHDDRVEQAISIEKKGRIYEFKLSMLPRVERLNNINTM